MCASVSECVRDEGVCGQMGALTALVEKRNVIVSAPTGSGKTVCGEVCADPNCLMWHI